MEKKINQKNKIKTNFSHVLRFSQDDLIKAWDAVAKGRLEAIENGHDRSYLEILLPTCLEFFHRFKSKKILDVGCGVGHLTRNLLNNDNILIGIDPSKVSIEIAKRNFLINNKISFLNTDIENFSKTNEDEFDSVVGNMLLMDVLKLEEVLFSIHRVLKQSGKAIFTICHPCFWPKYWGYENEPWFNYGKECAIKSDFRIKNLESLGAETIHFHRPLESYLNSITSSGLQVFKTKELFGTEGKDVFSFPRFLVIECEKVQI